MKIFDTPHRKYLSFANAAVSLAGKDVLEVGGCSPVNLIEAYHPTSWQCANLDANAVANFNNIAKERSMDTFVAQVQDITQISLEDKFDLAYSINAFEHVHDVEQAFMRIYQALRPGGYLFTLFGPIWSSDVGHHLSIPTADGKGLHFFEGALLPWEHLTSTPDAILKRLEKAYGLDSAQRAVEYIFRYPDLNRMLESDYLSIVRKSGFSTVLIIRNRKGKAPAIPGASNTRELLMVLRKGSVSAIERPVTFMKLAFAYFNSTRYGI